jgi:uncharacterized protein YbjT (DUF2867 family)
MSDKKKIIAVVGATGAQGGGLVHALLNDKESGFVVRALTRKTQSDKAKELAKLGAEVVHTDLDDYASIVKGFHGAHGVFCLTNFWEHFSPEKEALQANAMAKAAKETGVAHAIWSTLEDTRKWVPVSDDRMPTLLGKYKVPHFDAKGESDQVFAELGVPTTALLTSFYWENFIFFGMGPKKGPDGKLALTLPLGNGKKFPAIAVGDIGKCALGIFKRGSEFIGKKLGIAGEHHTGDELAAGFTKAFGQEVRYNEVTPATYRSFGFPGADDLGNMFQFNVEFADVFCGARNLSTSRSLNPAQQNFETWLGDNKSRIPLS